MSHTYVILQKEVIAIRLSKIAYIAQINLVNVLEGDSLAVIHAIQNSNLTTYYLDILGVLISF
jgi:hypothetical protein